jgi:hypothetical protein
MREHASTTNEKRAGFHQGVSIMAREQNSRPADDAIWNIASDRVKLLIEPALMADLPDVSSH